MFSKTFTTILAGATVLAGGAIAANMDDANSARNDDNIYSAVELLPEQGNVTIVGAVKSNVEDSDSFTLVDDKGKSIDIETSNKISLKEGERVQVKGQMDSKLLGMGREISAATVTPYSELSPAAGSSNERSDNTKSDGFSSNSNANFKGSSTTGASGTGVNSIGGQDSASTKIENSPDKTAEYDVDVDKSESKDGDTSYRVDVDKTKDEE